MLTQRQIDVICALRQTKCLSATSAGHLIGIAHSVVSYHIKNIINRTGHDPQTYDGMHALLEMIGDRDEKGHL